MTSTDNPLAPEDNGTTPIDAARQNGYLEIVELLKSSSKRPNRTEEDSHPSGQSKRAKTE